EYGVDSIIPVLGYTFLTGKLTGDFSLNKKFNAALSLKTGIIADKLDYNLIDSSYTIVSSTFIHRLDYAGYTFLIQPYAQCKFKFSDRLTVNGGLHGQFLTLNNSLSVEPRIGIRWDFKER